MESKSVTVEEILKMLTPKEEEEVLQDNFRIPLQLYLDGYNRNPYYPKEWLLKRFKSYARIRASVKSSIENNPDILKVEIKEPVFIIGMARSGTTMLHRLLNADPKFVAPMLWELVEPTPPGRPENFRECLRYKKAFEDDDYGGLVTGFLDKRHYSRMDLADECFAAMRPYFMNFSDVVQYLDMPELRDFIYHFPEKQAVETYEYYKKCLQCIFYNSLPEGSRILLKSPIHCLNLPTIKKVFPDAKFLFPIRNAKSMVSSFYNLTRQVWKIVDKDADEYDCGKRVLEIYKYKSQNAVKFFKQAPKDCYLPISYSEMTNNPIVTMKKIYSYLDWDLTPEIIDLMQMHVQENKQDKHGRPENVNAEDFGITDENLKENLKEYFEFFAEGPEKLM